eukprot:TRINITY_DN67015_c10_g1_i1.p1 TRINITY_DN67015_c10_g1~~TRINITY_DN67015_c10_g1_i1.p1  ORF type:complete len:576 (+),score=37.27 TRINITY_DN67015_c10_g1_i1:42-1730(+)
MGDLGIEEILDHRNRVNGDTRVLEYFIKWTPASNQTDSWENAQDVADIFPDVAEEYLANHPEATEPLPEAPASPQIEYASSSFEDPPPKPAKPPAPVDSPPPNTTHTNVTTEPKRTTPTRSAPPAAAPPAPRSSTPHPERITEERERVNGDWLVTEYLVRWTGGDETWELASDVEAAFPALLRKWKERKPVKKFQSVSKVVSMMNVFAGAITDRVTAARRPPMEQAIVGLSVPIAQQSAVSCYCHLPDGEVGCGNKDGSVGLWKGQATSAPKGKYYDSYAGNMFRSCPTEHHDGEVTCITPLRDGTFVSGGADGYLRIWRSRTGQCTSVLQGHGKKLPGLLCLHAHPSGDIISAAADHSIALWDPTTGQRKQLLTGHRDKIANLCIWNRHIVSCGFDNTVRLWDLESNSEAQVYRGHTNWVRHIVANEICDKGAIYSGSDDRTIRIWDPKATTGNGSSGCRGVCTGHVEPIHCLIMLNSNKGIVSGGWDYTLRHWKEDGKLQNVFRGHDGRVLHVVELNTGDILSSALNQNLKTWDLITGKCTRTYQVGQSRNKEFIDFAVK